MKLIELTQGQFAQVDDDDFERLSCFNWCAIWKPSAQSFYAGRHARKIGNGGILYIHRVIMNLEPGDTRYVDHIDHNGLNNQKSNLRPCTIQQNMFNSVVRFKKKTGFPRGVSCVPIHKRPKLINRWMAGIRVNGKHIHLGCFPTMEEAAKAHLDAAAKFFGEFSHTNSGVKTLASVARQGLFV